MRLLVLFPLALTGCIGFPWDRADVLASEEIGVDGGRIEGDGVALDIPAGALTAPTTITIFLSDREVDDQYIALSPVFRFEPAGLEFTMPTRVTIEVPGAASGAVLWTDQDDPTVFVFAGFVEDGVGIVETTHFSEGVAVEQASACAGSTDECGDGADGCDAPPPGEGDVGSITEPVCAAPRPESCRSLCSCFPPDSWDTLCVEDPSLPADADRNWVLGLCIGRPHPEVGGNVYFNGSSFATPVDATYHVATRSCEPCEGYQLRTVYARRCFCNGNVESVAMGRFERTPLCPVPIDPTHPAGPCPATIDTNGRAVALPRTGYDPRDAWGYRAWTGDGGAGFQQGHFLNYAGVPSMAQCAQECPAAPVEEPVGAHWVSVSGRTERCSTFAPEDGMLELTEDQRECCRLTADECEQLQQRRSDCMLPSRADESTLLGPCPCSSGQHCVDGACKWDAHTLSVLSTDEPQTCGDGSVLSEFTGLNRSAQELYPRGMSPDCPDEVEYDRNAWHGIGRTAPQSPGVNNNTSRAHAEGDALLQLATCLGRMPAQTQYDESGSAIPGSNWGAEEPADGVARSGSAEMIVDRTACGYACGPQGITESRRASNLERVTVHSPGGTTVYEEGGPPGGTDVTNAQTCE